MNGKDLMQVYDHTFGEPHTKIEGYAIDARAPFTTWYVPASFFLEAGEETVVYFKTYFKHDIHRFLNIRLRYLFEIFDRFSRGQKEFRLPLTGLDVGHRGLPEDLYDYAVEKNEFWDVWITLERRGWTGAVQQLCLDPTEFHYVQEKLELLRKELGL